MPDTQANQTLLAAALGLPAGATVFPTFED